MNPKTVNDLDPKLKETYERVMGTSLTPAGSSIPTQSPPIKATVAASPIPGPSVKPAPVMVASPQSTKPTPVPEIQIPSTGNLMKNATTTKKKKSSKVVLLIAGGIVFFVVYGVIWAKIFGLF